MNVVQLTAYAPMWLQYVLSALVALYAAATVVANAMHHLPASVGQWVAKKSPRLWHALQAADQFGTLVAPTMSSLSRAVKGSPVPDAPAVAVTPPVLPATTSANPTGGVT